jgi:hypothetical protein
MFLVSLLSVIASAVLTVIITRKIYDVNLDATGRAPNVAVMFMLSLVVSVGVVLFVVIVVIKLIPILHFDPDYGFVLFLGIAPVSFFLDLVVSLIVMWRQSTNKRG